MKVTIKTSKKELKISFMEKIVAEFKIFFANFQLGKKFFKLSAYDLIFYILLFIIIMVFYKVIGAKYVEMQQLLNIVQQGPSQMQGYAGQIKTLLYSAFFILGLLFLTLLGHYSLFKGFIWAKIYDKPFTMKNFWYFCLVNVILVIFIILIMFLFTLAKSQYLTTVLLSVVIPLLTIYLAIVFHPVAAISENLKTMFKQSFKIIFTKIHYYILPLLLLGITGIIINMFLNSLVFLKGIASSIVYLIFYVMFFTFAKLYLSKVLTLVEQA